MGCNSIWHLKGDVETVEYKCICWVGTGGIWRGELAGSEMQAAADGRQGKRQLGSANWAALRTEVWLSGLPHYSSICHSKPPSFRVLIKSGQDGSDYKIFRFLLSSRLSNSTRQVDSMHHEAESPLCTTGTGPGLSRCSANIDSVHE